jgi:hypothetical protein
MNPILICGGLMTIFHIFVALYGIWRARRKANYDHFE